MTVKKYKEFMNDKQLTFDFDKLEYVEDNGSKDYFVYPVRMKMLKESGYDDEKILKFIQDNPDKINISIAHYIIDTSSHDLYDKHFESWEKLQKNMSASRLHGRSKFTAGKDISSDGLVEKIILSEIQDDDKFSIKENPQDEYLDIISQASTSPDFEVMINDQKYLIEMKIGGDKRYLDVYNRSVWTDKTFTIRKGDIEREYGRYKKYNTPEHPLYFLRINPFRHEFSLVGYNEFIPSKIKPYDGSIFSYHTPISYTDLFDLGKKIKEEIKNKLIW